MSIQNVIKDQNKSWLVGNFNEAESNQVNVTADDIVTCDDRVVIDLHGVTPTEGQHIEKDGSNVITWASQDPFGHNLQWLQKEDLFTTTSATFVDYPFTFTATNLTAGDYVCYFSAGVQNTGGDIEVRTLTGVSPLNFWYVPGSSAFYQNVSGFKVVTVTTENSLEFRFDMRSPTAGTVQMHNVVFFFYKI